MSTLDSPTYLHHRPYRLVLIALGAVLGLALSSGDARATNVDCGVQTFVVDSFEDGEDLGHDCTCETAAGRCTLRAAVQEANWDADEDIIRFASGKHHYWRSSGYDGYDYYDWDGWDPADGSYWARSSYYDHVQCPSPWYYYSLYDAPALHRLTLGPIEIGAHLVIIGNGPCKTVIDARENDAPAGGECAANDSRNGRIFTTSAGGGDNEVNIVMMGLRLQNGHTEVDHSGSPHGCANQLAGGCMRNSTADLLLEDVHFKGCRAVCQEGVTNCSADAGALYNSDGEMTLLDAVFYGNHAADDGGAVNQGLILHSNHSATMRLFRAKFVKNEAPGDPTASAGRAGALINRAGRGWLGIYDSLFKRNTTGGQGGAIENRDPSDGGVISNSDFHKNRCDDGPTCGGAISNQGEISIQDDNEFRRNSPNDVSD